jgi:flagellin FlaB
MKNGKEKVCAQFCGLNLNQKRKEVNKMISKLKRVLRGEGGITGLETAIILIAFVVVAAVFAFTVLSAGVFSSEKGKEAVYSGMSEVRGSMETRGSLIATAATTGTSGTVDYLIFTVSNVAGGEPINLNTDNPVVVIDYRDPVTRTNISDWTVSWPSTSDGDALLEAGEMAEISVPIDDSDITLGPSTGFVIEVKPPSGAVLVLERTTPAYFDEVMDLH